MKTITGKLVNHPSFVQNLGSKLSSAAAAAGAAQTLFSAAKSIAPYIMGAVRIGSALL